MPSTIICWVVVDTEVRVVETVAVTYRALVETTVDVITEAVGVTVETEVSTVVAVVVKLVVVVVMLVKVVVTDCTEVAVVAPWSELANPRILLLATSNTHKLPRESKTTP